MGTLIVGQARVRIGGDMSPFDPSVHHRRSIRWKGYDYARPGAYFVTICVQGRACLFGEIAGDGSVLHEGGTTRPGFTVNDAGRMVEAVWRALPKFCPGVEPGEFVVMPNHVHGILILAERNGFDTGERHAWESAWSASLPAAIRCFKSLTTLRYSRGVEEHGWGPFVGRLWQRNYHEHVIRDSEEREQVRRYIAGNPANWTSDVENPARARGQDS